MILSRWKKDFDQYRPASPLQTTSKSYYTRGLNFGVQYSRRPVYCADVGLVHQKDRCLVGGDEDQGLCLKLSENGWQPTGKSFMLPVPPRGSPGSILAIKIRKAMRIRND